MDASIDLSDVDFYGVQLGLEGDGDVAVAHVVAHGAPAATDETVMAFHDVVVRLAQRGACLPNRFGLVGDRGRILADLADHHAEFAGHLDLVRNRDEVLVRARIVADDAVRVLGDRVAGLRRLSDAIEIGRRVHDQVAASIGADVDDAIRRCSARIGPTYGELHPDGLGADIVVLIDRGGEMPSVDALEPLGAYCQLERFDAGPCYRTASQLTLRLATPS